MSYYYRKTNKDNYEDDIRNLNFSFKLSYYNEYKSYFRMAN